MLVSRREKEGAFKTKFSRRRHRIPWLITMQIYIPKLSWFLHLAVLFGCRVFFGIVGTCLIWRVNVFIVYTATYKGFLY